jgi:hypothetical protein
MTNAGAGTTQSGEVRTCPWPDTAGLEKFSKTAISSQQALIDWGIAESEMEEASGHGIVIDILSLVAAKKGIVWRKGTNGNVRLMTIQSGIGT